MASLLVKASLAAAAPVAFSQTLIYGIFGIFAGPVSGLVAFVSAACLATPLLRARNRLPEPYYFLLHFAAGYFVGLVLSTLDLKANTTAEIFYGREVTLPVIASLAAWCYLYLFHPVGPDSDEEAIGVRATRFPLYTAIPMFVVSVCALGFLPGSRPYSEDEECHNVLRDQRSRNTPIERIRMTLPPDDEAKIKRFYADFALKHQLKTKGHPIHTSSAQTSMCNDRVTFMAGGFFEGRHGISVFEMTPDSEWQMLTEDLVCSLKEIWPGSLQFGDGGGRKHDLPINLKAHWYSGG